MPVVIDEVNAEIAPEPRAESAPSARERAPRREISEQVMRAIEREAYRNHRLSDR